MVDISTNVGKLKLKNPTILASGFLGVSASMLQRVANNGAGAVTTKSIGLEKRKGHHNPTVVEVTAGLLNAVGLSTPGINESLDELKILLKKIRVPVIVSIYGKTVKEYGIIAERVSEIKPSMLEVNISCPNVEDEFGRPFGTDAKTSAHVTKIVKNNTKLPVAVKLTPNVTDIKPIAKSVEEAGADAITAINTLGPGMLINIETKKPVLANRTGGLSGPAIKPIAVRCVYDIYETVDIPIIGMGGIMNGKDAVEFVLAGASAVGIGTGILYRGIDIFDKVNKEIKTYMKENHHKNLKQLIGKAHEE